VTATGAPPAEGELWLAPSTRLLLMRRVEIGLATAFLVAGAVVGGVASGATAAWYALGGVAVAAVLAERTARRRYRSWGYCERSRDLLVRRGVLFRRLTVVPYGRMQLIDVTAGAAERAFGLATIALHTAAATTDAKIPGLLPAEATRLRDRLAELGETQASGI
jgi:membrane protein YdbS with pleckstrin-like domain